MNRLLKLFFLDFKLLSKSKTFYLKLILFPMALILILGLMGSSDNSISKFTLAIYDENPSTVSSMLKDTLLNSKDMKNYISLKEVKSTEEGKGTIQKDPKAVFIDLPKDLEASPITLIGGSSSTLSKEIIKDTISSFLENYKTIKLEEAYIAKSGGTADNKGVLSHLENSYSYLSSIPKSSTNNKVPPITAIEYSAIAMMVMFSILTSFTLVHGVVEEKLNHTLYRIKSTPTLGLQYALGKLLSIVFALIMQMVIIIIICRFALGINLGNPLLVVLTTFSYAFCIGAIVLLCGFAAKDQKSVSAISTPILYGFSFLGGSFMSVYDLPDSLKAIQQIIPNGKAINCYLSIWQGKAISSISTDILQLLLIGLIFLTAAIYVFNGRKVFINANSNNDKQAA